MVLRCKVSIVTSYKPLYVILIPLSTGFFSELKIVAPFLVKSADKLESHRYPIKNRLELLRFGYVWACVAIDGNIGRGKCPESVGLIIEVLGRWALGPVVAGFEFFKIIVSWPLT